MFSKIKATTEEVAASLPGDDIVPNADVVMDRGFSLPATPDSVWPWFMQLGKNRAGWYLPRSTEHFFFPHKRALRHVEPELQNLKVGSVIDDWGGKHETFEVAILEPPHALVHKSKRGKTYLTWAIILEAKGADSTRAHLRLRLSPIGKKWLIKSGGEFFDALTVAGLAAGLHERLSK